MTVGRIAELRMLVRLFASHGEQINEQIKFGGGRHSLKLTYHVAEILGDRARLFIGTLPPGGRSSDL